MSKLAIHGGSPVRTDPFPRYNTVGDEEKRAVVEVMDDGVLSGFLGEWCPSFYGGPRVQALERAWEQYFDVRHAVTVNSATSGLYAAVGAAGVSPGDEVIVSPYSMTASATAPLIYGAIPVFADIEPDTFCMSKDAIRRCLTPRTRAILIVDLFGHPAAMNAVMQLAREHDLVVIEDAAQAAGATIGGRYAGALGHMGVFSLNCHKSIQTGEGGVVVTDDPALAERLQLIRNHAEAVVEGKGVSDLVNMVGFNYRMTEIEAAIGLEQLKKLERLVCARIDAAAHLTSGLRHLPGISPPAVHPDARHVYYAYAIRFDAAKVGTSRKRFVEAMRAEGIPLGEGYVRPLYLEPMYQQRTAVGRDGFPFTYAGYDREVSYDRGLCPVTERMHDFEVVLCYQCHAGLTRKDLDDVVRAFCKVSENVAALS